MGRSSAPGSINARRSASASFSNSLPAFLEMSDSNSSLTSSMVLWLIVGAVTALAIGIVYWYTKRASRRDRAILQYNHAEQLFRLGHLSSAVKELNSCIDLLETYFSSDISSTNPTAKTKIKMSESDFEDLCLKSNCYHLRARATTDGITETSADFPLSALNCVVSDHQLAIKFREIIFEEEKKTDPTSSPSTLASYYYYYGYSLERAKRSNEAVNCYQKVFSLDAALGFLPTMAAKAFQERIDGNQTEWNVKNNKNKFISGKDEKKDKNMKLASNKSEKSDNSTDENDNGKGDEQTDNSVEENVSSTSSSKKTSQKKKSKKMD